MGGNRRKTPPFVMLYHRIIDSPAFVGLHGNPAKLLLILCRHYDGENNGNIHLSERQAAAALGCTKATASKAFKALIDAGFIVEHRKGRFDPARSASTAWRLTIWPAFGKPATQDYTRK